MVLLVFDRNSNLPKGTNMYLVVFMHLGLMFNKYVLFTAIYNWYKFVYVQTRKVDII